MNKVKITLHKTQFEFHFGLGFLGELVDNLDMGIDEIMGAVSKNPFKIIPVIMHSSAGYSAKRNGKEFDYTVYDFIDMIDADGGIGGKSVEKFLTSFTGSMTKDVPVEETKKKTESPAKK